MDRTDEWENRLGQVDEHAKALYGVPELENQQAGDGFAEWCQTAGAELARAIAETVSKCGEVGLWLLNPNESTVPHALLAESDCVRALYAEYEAAHGLGECLASSGDPAANDVQTGVRAMYWALTVAHKGGAPTP